MPKQGILHDYDLMANMEGSAQGRECKVCDTDPMSFQWSDYSGEAMCTKCGAPYQLKWGSKEMEEEGKYPYFKLNDKFTPIAKQYWKEKERFVCYGTMLGPRPGIDDLVAWLKIHFPEHVTKPEEP